MTKYHAPYDRVPNEALKTIAEGAAVANRQVTTYVIDGSGQCVAIIGNVEQTPQGEATKLEGFGIATRQADDLWVKL